MADFLAFCLLIVTVFAGGYTLGWVDAKNDEWKKR
jgi:hypothetical protein